MGPMGLSGCVLQLLFISSVERLKALGSADQFRGNGDLLGLSQRPALDVMDNITN